MQRLMLVLFFLAILPDECQQVFAATKLISHSTINPRVSPLWIAQEKGYFQKYGIDATSVFGRNTPLMIAGMKTGTIPIAPRILPRRSLAVLMSGRATTLLAFFR